MELDRPTWFVDPVDGTTNYFRGIPHYACAVALWDRGGLQLGVVVDVRRRRTYWAEAGRGSYEGRRRLSVSTIRSVQRSVLATGFPPSRAHDRDNNLAEFLAVVNGCRDVRRLGCAGIDMAWVAAGRLDAYWEQRCGPWDWAAGTLFVREAGGRVTTFDGQDWRPGDGELVRPTERSTTSCSARSPRRAPTPTYRPAPAEAATPLGVSASTTKVQLMGL